MNKKAFTIIEIILGIVIIAILAAVVVPKFIDIRSEARQRSEEYTIGAVREAIQQSYARSLVRDDVPVYPPYLDDIDTVQLGAASSQNPLFNEVLTGITSQWELLSMALEESWYKGPTGTEYAYNPADGSMSPGAFGGGGEGGGGGEPPAEGQGIAWSYPGTTAEDLGVTLTNIDIGGTSIGALTDPTNFELLGISFMESVPDTSGSDGLYGGTGTDYATCMEMTYDENDVHDGYIVAGNSNSFNEMSGIGTYVLKMNLDGTVAWSKNFGVGMGAVDVNTIKQTDDGGYVFGGIVHSMETPNGSAFLMKIDSAGNLNANPETGDPGGWSVTYGVMAGPNDVKSVAVSYDTDGNPDGYVVTGEKSGVEGFGSPYSYMAKIDLNGSMSWSNTYTPNTASNSSLTSCIQTSDGGYIATGSDIRLGATNSADAMIMKFSSTGTLEWTKTYGSTEGYDAGQAIVESRDENGDPNGYLIRGVTFSYGGTNNSSFIAKLDTSGNLVQSKLVDSANTNQFSAFQQSSDGGYVLGGTTRSYGDPAESDAYIIKLDSNMDQEWSNAYVMPGNNAAVAIVEASAGGYAIAGNGIRDGFGIDFSIIKTDSLGNL